MEREKEKEEKGRDFRDTATHAENMAIPPENVQKEKAEKVEKEKEAEKTERGKGRAVPRGSVVGRMEVGKTEGGSGLHRRRART